MKSNIIIECIIPTDIDVEGTLLYEFLLQSTTTPITYQTAIVSTHEWSTRYIK